MCLGRDWMRRVNTLALKAGKGIATTLRLQLVAHCLNGDIRDESKAYCGQRRLNLLLTQVLPTNLLLQMGLARNRMQEKRRNENGALQSLQKECWGNTTVPSSFKNITQQQNFFLHIIKFFEIREIALKKREISQHFMAWNGCTERLF